MEQKLYNLDKLNEIAQGDEAFTQNMLATFLESVSTDIGTVKSFRLQENWSAVAEKAHKLASNFAYLNADTLQKQAVSIEKSVIDENNLSEIAEKTDKLCNDCDLLIEQLKQDFGFLRE